MARNGSGVHAKLPGSVAVTGTAIDSSDYNDQIDDIVTSLNDTLLLNGVKPMTGALAMGTHKITGGSAGTDATDFVILSQVQQAAAHAASTGGASTDAIVLTYSPVYTAYTTNMKIAWKSGGVNTVTNPTLDLDAIATPKTIKKGASVALAVGDLGVSGTEHEAVYNGTDWILLNPATNAMTTAANTFVAAQVIGVNDAGTNTVTDILTVKHTSSGTAAASFGAGLVYQLEDAAGNTESAASVDAIWTDATNASEDAKISFKTMVAGSAKAEAGFIAAGLVMGSPTGGDKGAGTINATTLYQNGTAVTTFSRTLITTFTTTSGSSFAQTTGISGYRHLELEFDAVDIDVSGSAINLAVSGNSGTNYGTATSIGGAGNGVRSGTLVLMGVSGAFQNACTAITPFETSGVVTIPKHATGATTAINAIRITSTGDNFNGGSLRVYGVL